MNVIIKFKLNDLSNIHHILENSTLKKACVCPLCAMPTSKCFNLYLFAKLSNKFFFLGPCFWIFVQEKIGSR